MPRPKDPAIRLLLLERAAAMLSRREPVTLRTLVEDTPVSSMAVYTHFGGMDGMWSALRQEGFVRLSARLGEVPATKDPVRDLAALAVAYTSNALEHPDLYRVMFDAAVDLQDHDAADDTLEVIVQAAARGVDAGRFDPLTVPLALATRVWIAVHGLASVVANGPLPRQALDHGPGILVALLTAAGDDRLRCEKSVRAGWRP